MKTKIKIIRKLFSLTVLILFIQCTSFSQSCFPEGYEFFTQAEIDSFPINYPNCTSIEGNVIIHCFNGINNLHGLNKITSMGHLFVWGSTGSDSLKNLTGLDNLRTLGGLIIDFADGLKDLTGLNNLNFVNGKIEMRFNGFTSLSGLENLITVNGGILILDNDSLKSLSGLNNLTLINGGLDILFNKSLKNFSGLDNLKIINGGLIVVDNDSLTSLEGLNNLTTIVGNIQIQENSQLTSLAGIENIDPVFNYLSIHDNPLLSTCEIKSVCDYLANPTGPIVIHDNAEGCNGQAEVEDACNAIGVSELYYGMEVSIHPNPCSSQLTLDFENMDKSKVVYNIYTLAGKVVDEGIIDLTKTISVHKLKRGQYLIKLEIGKMHYIGKFIKL